MNYTRMVKKIRWKWRAIFGSDPRIQRHDSLSNVMNIITFSFDRILTVYWQANIKFSAVQWVHLRFAAFYLSETGDQMKPFLPFFSRIHVNALKSLIYVNQSINKSDMCFCVGSLSLTHSLKYQPNHRMEWSVCSTVLT